MILVLDIEVSERALALRKKVLQMGLPCAVSFPPFAVEYLRPIACVLTFQDVAERVQVPHLYGVPMLALGEGSVSKMLPVQVFATEALLFANMEKISCYRMGWQGVDFCGKQGYFLDYSFVKRGQELQYQLYVLPFTKREKHIFMTLLSAKEQQNSYRRIEAYSFPYPYHENEKEVADSIATHISNINKKIMKCCQYRFIHYDRKKCGGYVLQHPGCENEI